MFSVNFEKDGVEYYFGLELKVGEIEHCCSALYLKDLDLTYQEDDVYQSVDDAVVEFGESRIANLYKYLLSQAVNSLNYHHREESTRFILFFGNDNTEEGYYYLSSSFSSVDLFTGVGFNSSLMHGDGYEGGELYALSLEANSIYDIELLEKPLWVEIIEDAMEEEEDVISYSLDLVRE